MTLLNRISTGLLQRIIHLLPAGKKISLAKTTYRLVEADLAENEEGQLRKAILDAAFGSLHPPWPPTEIWAWRKYAYDRFMKRFTMQSSYEMGRQYGLIHLLEKIRNVPGGIVECGVGHGKTLTILVYGAQILQLNKMIYGFDSFAGFPEATEEDIGPRVKKIGKPGGWKATSPAYIQSMFTTDRQRKDSILDMNDEQPQLIPGFFADTLPNHLPAQIAFLHVDCDLYSSTQDVLKYCLPKMARGGVVIFDEYHDPKWPGATQAIDEVGAKQQLEPVYFPYIDRYGWQL